MRFPLHSVYCARDERLERELVFSQKFRIGDTESADTVLTHTPSMGEGTLPEHVLD